MYILTKGLDTLDAKVSGKEQRCIHTDDWGTIIRYARTNPWVYRKCMKNGCTKSVKIKFPAGSKLYNTNADEYEGIVTANSDGSHTVKYAVSIYGIRQDESASGNLIGLTFGPATGEKYTDGYRCHTESIWKVAGKGDGASVLYDSINPDYRIWNCSSGTNANNGGWPGSRVRATLNGADQYTASGSGVDTGRERIYYDSEYEKNNAGTDVLWEPDALIAAFPAELRSAIVPKAVASDTKWEDCSSTDYTFTTYDRLWLFSGAEIYQDAGTNNKVIRSYEGIGDAAIPCNRAVKLGIATNRYRWNKGYKESGISNSWWLRSLNREYSYSVNLVASDGDWFYHLVNNCCGLSVGFCVGSR